MDIKTNHTSENRRAGDRIIDAPHVFIDIPGFIAQLKSEKSWDKNDRNGITVFKSEDITIVISAIKSGGLIHNKTKGFITLLVLDGEIQISFDHVESKLGHNQAVVLHPGIMLSILAMSDTILMLTTYNKSTPNIS